MKSFIYLCTIKLKQLNNIVMRVELRSIKIYPDMSEETTAMSCRIFIDGIEAGIASNEGRGGCTNYTPYQGFQETFRQLEIKMSETPDIVYPKADGTSDFTLKCTFENWIDFEIANEGNKKFQNKLSKDMLKGICFGSVMSYSLLSWKNYTLDQLLNSPVGKATIQNKVNELKAKGENIINTNLVGISI